MSGINFKKILSSLTVFGLCLGLTSCFENNDSTKKETLTNANKKEFKIAMMTDKGDINDGSFNQSTYEGLKELEKNNKVKVTCLRPKDDNDFVPTLDKLVDNKNDLIFAIGFNLNDAVVEASKNAKNATFVLIDGTFEKIPENAVSVTFCSEQPAFMAGYVAAKTSKSGKVGFVGGKESYVIGQFEYGYRAGVEFAAKEMGKKIIVEIQYIETFSDAAIAKSTAQKMISSECDIIFQACGGAGKGVIEAAKEAKKFAIGVDMDQSKEAPDAILTSALKNTGKAAKTIFEFFMKGEKISKKSFNFGLKEGCVGLPEKNKNMDKKVYEDVMGIKGRIISGEIIPPSNKEEFDKFMSKI